MKKLVQMRPAAAPDFGVETLLFVQNGQVLLRLDTDLDFSVSNVALELMRRFSVATMGFKNIEVFSLCADKHTSSKVEEVLTALHDTKSALTSDIPKISARERTVLNCLLENKVNKEIADDLSITTRTVKFHVSNLFSKFGCASRSELTNKFRPVVHALVSE